MDIPACTSAAEGYTCPPPAYNDFNKFPIYEEILPSPPPEYTIATAPPLGRGRGKSCSCRGLHINCIYVRMKKYKLIDFFSVYSQYSRYSSKP